MSVPMLLTVMRIVIIPFIVYALFDNQWLIALILFIAAALTDLMDGFFARWLKQESALGALLDPIADKLLIMSTLMTLFYQIPVLHTNTFFFVSMTIICIKEIVLIMGTISFVCTKRVVFIKPTLLGKCAMTFQVMLIICVLFWTLTMGNTIIITIGMIGGAIIALCAGLQYAYIGWNLL